MIEFLTNIWNEFWVIVWIPPFLWAFVLLLDVFQSNHIFQDRWDGPVISSLFLVLPGLGFYLFFPFELPDLSILLVMLISGGCSALAIFYYFSALKHRDDVVIADSLNSMAIVLVPLINYIFFGVDYNPYGISAIVLAFLSALLFAFEYPHRIPDSNNASITSFSHDFWKAFIAMMVSVLFLTGSIVTADQAYMSVSFPTGMVLFCVGHLLVGSILWVLSPNFVELSSCTNPTQPRKGILVLIKNNWRVFLTAEIIAVIAIVFFQRAVDLGDAAVATIIESTAPFMVMLTSVIIVSARFSSESVLTEISKRQLHNPVIKTLASIGMLFSLVLAFMFIQ